MTILFGKGVLKNQTDERCDRYEIDETYAIHVEHTVFQAMTYAALGCGSFPQSDTSVVAELDQLMLQ